MLESILQTTVRGKRDSLSSAIYRIPYVGKYILRSVKTRIAECKRNCKWQ